jgi:hypothetical protein
MKDLFSWFTKIRQVNFILELYSADYISPSQTHLGFLINLNAVDKIDSFEKNGKEGQQ